MKTKLSPALQLEAMLSGKTKTHRTGNKMEMLNQKIKELELKLESANERIKRLEEAGNELSKLLGFSIGNDEDVEWACSLRVQKFARCDRAISEWNKAKEAKL